NGGLACMFTMMNYERLSVGLQGLGAGELAYQQASRYARDRLQGRAPAGPANPDGGADSLLAHPAVRRMLLTVRAYTEGGRAFAVFAGLKLDRAKHAHDRDCQALSELLTPLAKAFLSDRGFECAVMAQQVFGGHGFIREWGVEQIVRDARIAQIYEGTNGIQALDFVARKVCRDGGRTLYALLDAMAASSVPERYRAPLKQALERLRSVTERVIAGSQQDANLPGAVSTDYLDLAGHTIYAWLWARMAGVSGDDEFGRAKRRTADFFYARLLPKTLGLEASVLADTDSLMGFEEAAF
ncbi:MAG: acyl-CoA dehydrogenase C-terminal domain-containing protein, partial [Gammaproteobacteria bacterium]|nr:acyl-CoA dehydrogenase C-terminal domain-containing protein [Gammaproteobacteria bacterium]